MPPLAERSPLWRLLLRLLLLCLHTATMQLLLVQDTPLALELDWHLQRHCGWVLRQAQATAGHTNRGCSPALSRLQRVDLLRQLLLKFCPHQAVAGIGDLQAGGRPGGGFGGPLSIPAAAAGGAACLQLAGPSARTCTVRSAIRCLGSSSAWMAVLLISGCSRKDRPSPCYWEPAACHLLPLSPAGLSIAAGRRMKWHDMPRAPRAQGSSPGPAPSSTLGPLEQLVCWQGARVPPWALRRRPSG
jgi:hypothetical protein